MAVEAHHPRTAHRPRMVQPKAAARGLAVWVVPAEGTSPELLARAAQLVLARALQTAPEAEVHWPAAGAPTSGVSADAGGGTADDSSQPSSAAENPGGPGQAPSEDDGGTRLPPSAGPVSRVAVDLAAETVLLDGRPVPLTGVEYKVLRYLVTHLSRTVGREELQEFLESLHFPGATARSIDVYVGRIRRKLGNARHAVATVRGGGYQFVPGSCATVRGPAEYCI
ncbi:response regulator with CheY-like receiver domain and winged-helix DNA-binding domain [Pseudarthrobacter phenanthrenivorans Sphe3]|uniref:Response regulator with CheY-like receiver domain and winged-helix DNA-binding domain n=1 Tax=Pseudarthrobacter phenanthrenivorans (strain DSM 18606 / JCM 16027 / LMG 23796 / Sphe3) TaxID=930171 RepID=F0M624_PSEPM|nr:winged helix-turn-helix domain-containing protein [Pseudarthrobacter phenanthrenivorans]ADX74680.1 response regulator with CheY-like receiver domain and winged-helix DNA-binding domain [Pseudarthrobacter phenanthrenivorans Sphe3]